MPIKASATVFVLTPREVIHELSNLRKRKYLRADKMIMRADKMIMRADKMIMCADKMIMRADKMITKTLIACTRCD